MHKPHQPQPHCFVQIAGGPGQLVHTNINKSKRAASVAFPLLRVFSPTLYTVLSTPSTRGVALRFRGVPTHIYKTAVRSLHLIYIAVLARAELRVLLVKYADTPFRLHPPVPSESLPTARNENFQVLSPILCPHLYIYYTTVPVACQVKVVRST